MHFFFCFTVLLFSVFENSGNLVVQEVATQPLTQDLLNSSVIGVYPLKMFLRRCCIGNVSCLIVHCLFFLLCQDCYMLDQGGSSVMVWKGKHSSKEERREALNRAMVSLL